MKFDAHPLLVAVAFGLLGPGALMSDEDADDPDTEVLGAGEERVGSWEPGPAPSAEEFHRVELEWLKQG